MTKKNVVVDPTLPKVPLELDGKKYFLVFDFNAVVIAESLTGLNLLNALDLRNLSASSTRALLYAALLKVQPDLTLEAVGNLITEAGRKGEVNKIPKALVKAYLESQPEEEKDPNAQTPE